MAEGHTAHDVEDISLQVWAAKYRFHDEGKSEKSIEETWQRIARSLAAAEPHAQGQWQRRFMDALSDFRPARFRACLTYSAFTGTLR